MSEYDLARQVRALFDAAREKGMWIGGGFSEDLPLTDEYQYGPLSKALLKRVDQILASKEDSLKKIHNRVLTLLEGNVMLDNEPVLFVRGYERALFEIAALFEEEQAK